MIKLNKKTKEKREGMDLYNPSTFNIPVVTKLGELLYWKSIDIYRTIKTRNKGIHLYGIYGYLGLPGFGKTMAMSNELLEIRKKYGDKVIIMTNYGFKYEDEPFTNWNQLLLNYDKPLIVGWDEIQNLFSSRDFKSFPIGLLTLLTQNRKGNGKRIYYTCQRFGRIDKIFRELTITMTDCKTHFGRLTSLKTYDCDDYAQLINQTDVNLKMKVRPIKKKTFIQTDFIRNCYDSYQMLESAKNTDYMDRVELALLDRD